MNFNKYALDKGISSLTQHYHQSRIRSMTPMITEEFDNNTSTISVFDKLMKDRIIFLGMPIDDMVANIINAQLLYLSSESTDPIKMYINSPGGSVYDGLAIYDTMEFIQNDVHTIVTGLAASMSFILAINGTKGCRKALKHSRFMQHQVMSGIDGQGTDIAIHNKEVQTLKKELIDIVVDKTGQPLSKIKKDMERDYWMRADLAKAYGCVDEVIARK